MVQRRILQPFLIVGFLALASCSTAPSAPAPTDYRTNSIELYLSRANLVEAEFEQFKTQGNKLFVECGKIRRGRFVPEAQDVFPLSDAELQRLNEGAWSVAQFLDHDFDSPGDNSSLADPGQAYFTIQDSQKKAEIKTALDSVTSQTTPADTALYDLASALRKASGGAPCGNRSFYGIR